MEIKVILFDWYGVMDGFDSKYMLKLAYKLKRNYGVGILSNMSSAGKMYICSLKNVCKNFDYFITSSDIGYYKPEKEIYIEAIKLLKTQPSEIVFIDDSYDNVESAQHCGMIGIYFEGYEKLHKDLQILKLKL